jgi:hypothetical protein
MTEIALQEAHSTLRPVPPYDFELTGRYATYGGGRYGADVFEEGAYTRLLWTLSRGGCEGRHPMAAARWQESRAGGRRCILGTWRRPSVWCRSSSTASRLSRAREGEDPSRRGVW